MHTAPSHTALGTSPSAVPSLLLTGPLHNGPSPSSPRVLSNTMAGMCMVEPTSRPLWPPKAALLVYVVGHGWHTPQGSQCSSSNPYSHGARPAPCRQGQSFASLRRMCGEPTSQKRNSMQQASAWHGQLAFCCYIRAPQHKGGRVDCDLSALALLVQSSGLISQP